MNEFLRPGITFIDVDGTELHLISVNNGAVFFRHNDEKGVRYTLVNIWLQRMKTGMIKPKDGVKICYGSD